MSKPKPINLKTPDAPASFNQKKCIARFNRDKTQDPFKMPELTMIMASEWIERLTSTENPDAGKDFAMSMSNPATAEKAKIIPMPVPARQKPRLHDDIMFDILGIAEKSAVSVCVKDISTIFRDHDHRVDEYTINLALNKAVSNPASLFYAEARAAIVTKKIVKPSFGKGPVWYTTFFPPIKALVVKPSFLPIEHTDTKFDGAIEELNEILDEASKRPGMKKRIGRVRDIIERGAIAVGQEKSSFMEKMERQDQKMNLIMERLGITDESGKRVSVNDDDKPVVDKKRNKG